MNYLENNTDLFVLRDIFRQIANFAKLNKIELTLPSVFENTIIPKYRDIAVRRIARRVPLFSNQRSVKHRIKIPLSEKTINWEESIRGIAPNIIQSLDAAVLLITVYLLKQKFNSNFPFIGLCVHDSISLHSSFFEVVKKTYVKAHHDLYRYSNTNFLTSLNS